MVRDSIGLYTVAKEKFKDSIKIFHLSEEEIGKIVTKMNVSERAKKSLWIRGTHAHHFYEMVEGSTNQLRIKLHSLADKSTIVKTCP